MRSGFTMTLLVAMNFAALKAEPAVRGSCTKFALHPGDKAVVATVVKITFLVILWVWSPVTVFLIELNRAQTATEAVKTIFLAISIITVPLR